MKRFNFISTLAAVVVLSISVYADVPKLINYQGRLTNPAGAPVPNATYPVTFTIWDVPAGGTPLWSELHSVVTNDGLFSVQLGTFVILPDNIFDGTSRYVGVTVSPDPEMPRQRLVSTPYSYRVRTVDGATGGNLFGDLQLHSTLTIGDNAGDVGKLQITDGSSTIIVADGATGSVGIGTATPGNLLHISDAGNPAVRIQGTGINASPRLNFESIVRQWAFWNEAQALWGPNGYFHLIDLTANTPRLTVDVSGNVGIGTASPAQKLDVAGTAQVTGFKMPTGATSSYVLTSDATGVGTWQSAATPKYKIYCAVLSQSGTNAPIATVLENTIGAIVWSRLGVGIYFGTLAGAFPDQNKTPVFVSSALSGGYSNVSYWNSVNQIRIQTSSSTDGLFDGLMTPMSIEIRVYP